MKDVDFVSSANGLKVSIPGDAIPTPNCGDTMCVISEYTGCMSQPSWGESPVVFSFIAGVDDVEVGFRAGNFGTVIGPFDGALGDQNLFSLTYRTDLGNLYTNLNTLYAAGAATVRVIAPNGQSHLFTGSINSGGFQAQGASQIGSLQAGETYCVVITFTPI